jgi:hypothetical protein
MRIWRLLAAVLGSSLMVGETIRSWGQGRNLLFVLDDFVIGKPLVVTAVLIGRPSVIRHCAFSASFAASSGMLYGSFFGKLISTGESASSNIEMGTLTVLTGLAFASSILGLFGSLRAAKHWHALDI